MFLNKISPILLKLARALGIDIVSIDDMKHSSAAFDAAGSFDTRFPNEIVINLYHRDIMTYTIPLDLIVLHELAHSTGVENRLARHTICKIQMTGSLRDITKSDYSTEELTAQLAASKLGSILLGNSFKDFTDDYIQSYKNGDLVRAMSDANKIVHYCMNKLEERKVVA